MRKLLIPFKIIKRQDTFYRKWNANRDEWDGSVSCERFKRIARQAEIAKINMDSNYGLDVTDMSDKEYLIHLKRTQLLMRRTTG